MPINFHILYWYLKNVVVKKELNNKKKDLKDLSNVIENSERAKEGWERL